MKNFKQTKQFLFRLFLAGIFLILYAVTASAVPVSAQGGISDDHRKASASLITWDAYQGLDEAELSSGVWQFCGRAELGKLPGETYYDGALYVETLGDRSGGFVFEGARTAGLAHHPDGPLKPLCGRDGSLNDYDFSAHRLNSALALWTAPDPMARDFSNINPYVYCAANPIRYTDPSGKIITENGVPFQYSCGRPVSIPENKLIKSNEKDLEEATYNVCCLFTSAGVPFIALQLTDKKETNELTPSGFDYTSNCHGYTFLNGEYWINSESSVDAVLSEYLPISNPDLIEAGDVVVYKTENTDDNPAEFGSGDLIYAHSAKIAGEDNNGDYKLDAKMSNAKPQTESYNKNKRGYRETSVYKKTPVDRPLKKGEKWKLENLAIQLINEYIAKKKQESNNK